MQIYFNEAYRFPVSQWIKYRCLSEFTAFGSMNEYLYCTANINLIIVSNMSHYITVIRRMTDTVVQVVFVCLANKNISFYVMYIMYYFTLHTVDHPSDLHLPF